MTIKVMVLPRGLLAEIDRIAKEEQRSRVELLIEATRICVALRRSKKRPGDDPGVRAAIAIQDAIAAKALPPQPYEV